MHLQFVGCGDAFGSGGRLNTCFHLVGDRTNLLIDCGASSLIGLKRLGIDRNAIDLILVTHFHADHFGGIPFFILDAQFFAKRARPLVIAGPSGLVDWYRRAMETAFPGSSGARRTFEVSLVELRPAEPWSFGAVSVLPALVRHGHPEGPFHAYRITAEGRTVAYTGDTEWSEALVGIGRDADLFIAEAYSYDRKRPLHLDYATLAAQLPRIAPRRLMLTHMDEGMLARRAGLPHEAAEDGLIVQL